ncbi:MAG: pantetheine-phosphate adenylyltransferase [Candidatus Parvarchaeota archaeon]|nr:pantetheine-phosphate adenylyltransferase [Candidatus Jingweiarchaeum tengchongense]MCW1297774.1 pantetheine-phosphate adenylyltransferase [Candidatus Jingweiarchaeum tengchongense]MCW1299784.1 pantetheine-phosphate adenylyltransferase [Candidatus Jingweiarchaeum tengchongense]MCW1304245.1 pantetheine-phosphate adenylyltransferase [Candidatus Jingweiarchaeum tengchongense]MCW1305273.1 pantetheine-phosphate adenylyltransferase [Candidatus Jingweiarchaeum tengchongense]
MDDLFLTRKVRNELKKPLGMLIIGRNKKRVVRKILRKISKLKYEKLICVGDTATNSFLSIGFRPDICIFDGRIRRNRYIKVKLKPTLYIYNPPSSINKEAWKVIKRAIKSKKKENIFVEGEEDLLVIPCVILSKNNIVVYGQPSKGIVFLTSDKETRKKFVKIIKKMKKGKFEKVIVGGTFDRLHIGHKFFLKTASFYGRKMIVGLTSDEMCRKKTDFDKIWKYDKRKKVLYRFLKRNKIKFEIVKIHDIFGPALKIRGECAIVVTGETEKNAIKINKKRMGMGLKEIEMIVLYFIKSKDGKIISSSRIRAGEIDRNGKLILSNIVF